MIEAKLTLEIPGLASALEHLAAAISQRGCVAPPAVAPAPVPAPVPSTGAVVPYSAPPAAGPAQPPAGNPTAGPAPVATAPMGGPAVPPGNTLTAPAPGVTLAQVSKAGADLLSLNPAKMPELRALLQQFGVPAISELKPEQLGAFATALRGLGAKI